MTAQEARERAMKLVELSDGDMGIERGAFALQQAQIYALLYVGDVLDKHFRIEGIPVETGR